jgi:hypothetical protein
MPFIPSQLTQDDIHNQIAIMTLQILQLNKNYQEALEYIKKLEGVKLDAEK